MYFFMLEGRSCFLLVFLVVLFTARNHLAHSCIPPAYSTCTHEVYLGSWNHIFDTEGVSGLSEHVVSEVLYKS